VGRTFLFFRDSTTSLPFPFKVFQEEAASLKSTCSWQSLAHSKHTVDRASGISRFRVDEEASRTQPLLITSNGCKLRGGPKILREIIASRKPDVDRSKAAMSLFSCMGIGIGGLPLVILLPAS
jgi:hypothetical protein